MTAPARLLPSQVCFVVDDVRGAAEACSERFGWGPFHHFTARVPEAHYRGFRGRRENDVALGMAGRVQVELIHVNEGREPISEYQDRYGTGFQHLGVACRSLEAGIARLAELGGVVAERNEHEGVGLAFVDIPTGPAMFELLQFPPRGEGNADIQASARVGGEPVLALDRATIVTDDMDTVLRFYSEAFGWDAASPRTETLRYGEQTAALRRFAGRAGALVLELLEPCARGDDPYSAHLERGPHGLVHAGGVMPGTGLPNPSIECEWQERGERFVLYDWAGGRRALQARLPG